ncbi:MAPEG family protein [Novosphingobium sp. FKTRR1]|uniref:MAPEG family protein n=1 Tax=Novosphingobium sp. FKTRR1 TaxID=2879118 RepID=UPI001CF0B6FD|nr:MAPEG family protein [Novosphingobium sp. FKTRR1]
MILPVTLSSAGAAALLNIWLCIRIGMVRTAKKISVGDGGDEDLVRRMRAQANFVENTPFILVLLAAIELARGSSLILAGVAGLYMLGRVAHGVGMDGGVFGKGRMAGTLITMLTLLGLGVWAVSIALDA